MRKTGLRNKFLQENEGAQQKNLPKDLRGEVKAQYCPKDTTDWPLGELKEYKRVATLDGDGVVTYTYMEAKWMGKGADTDREQFTYLLCTHLTLHLFCIGPNYWNYIWSRGPSEESMLSVDDKKTHTGAWTVFTDDWQNKMFGILRPCFFAPREPGKIARSLLGMQEPRGTSLPFMVIST